MSLTLAACSQQPAQPLSAAQQRAAVHLTAGALHAQSTGSIVVTPSTASNPANATTLANTLVGAGVTVSNATLTGAPAASGTFTGGTAAFLFDKGVILSSGSAASVVGPNNLNAPTQASPLVGASDSYNTAGDSDLLALAKTSAQLAGAPDPGASYDASVLQFDFVPTKDLVYFSYVFASEEYLEWVKTEYNDAFGFYINGVNCAMVPGFTGSPPAPVPVTVNTINTTKNPALFRNNTVSGPLTNETQADGLTTVLTCSAKVNPGVVNHAKLAIADMGDNALNSWVMIQAGSFSTTNPNGPVLTLPADQTVEATGPNPLSVPFTVTASDVQDGDLTPKVKCDQTTPLSVALGQTVTVKCSVADSGGLTASGQFTVKVVDTTKPTITLTTPVDGATYAPNQIVKAQYTCTDTVGIASCTGTVDSGASIDTSTLGPKTFTVTAKDTSGNEQTTTVTYKVVDSIKPTISLVTPTNGAVYSLNQVVASSYSCADETALASCVGTVPSGIPIDTATFGIKTFTVTAKDTSGNTQTTTVSYSVQYPFAGFFQPVDNLPMVNTVKAGQAIPIKFSLGGNYGLNIFAAGSPTSALVPCNQTAPVDDIEQTVTAGGSSLSYDPGSKMYNYVWKTDKAWANTCRLLTVTLNDGSVHKALFNFR
ncbi:hypothetical protein E7T09_04055 [Deinococcus sp. KSM4-11]|uniref:choice-of-anchor L domain-containing protein n=1 Tax=Deinococcus sp. KSM4-11 TaxID=2568654 RepID=UPI0010A55B93|nr:choice-of-anchor L domain-containing protein [Deinococcus sp. KSM4-11]THF88387.1 hypothetical protein E7T09_04055 [Deinococcus sp. KSM4-11]